MSDPTPAPAAAPDLAGTTSTPATEPQPVKLREFTFRRARNATLTLRWLGADDILHASLRIGVVRVAFAWAYGADVYIDDESEIWLGKASFTLSVNEIEQIRAAWSIPTKGAA